MAPGTGPVTPYTECSIGLLAKDIQVGEGDWTIEWRPYCFRCNVFVDPDVPHVPLLDSTHEAGTVSVQPDESDVR